MKKILITGSDSFIGRNLKEQLEGKYEIHAPKNNELNLLDNKKVWNYIKPANFDAVIHCATCDNSTSTKEAEKVFPNNLKMFINLARCNEYYDKLIFYGSCTEYGKKHYKPLISEDDFGSHIPTDNFGISKYFMSKYALRVDNIYNLRLFGVFGKYDNWRERFVSNICCKTVWDIPIKIRQNLFSDYTHIDDIVNISEWFIKNKPTQKSYNLCSGKLIDLLKLANKIISTSGKNLKVKVIRKKLGKELSGNNSRLLSEIGDYRFRNIDEGINELYNWYLEHKDTIDKKQLN